jgi:hypothetical protein
LGRWVLGDRPDESVREVARWLGFAMEVERDRRSSTAAPRTAARHRLIVCSVAGQRVRSPLERVARPLDWNSIRQDLARLHTRLAQYEPQLALAAYGDHSKPQERSIDTAAAALKRHDAFRAS